MIHGMVRRTSQLLEPDSYMRSTRDERLAGVRARASAVPENGNPAGHVVGEGCMLAADFERAQSRAERDSNIQLQRGGTSNSYGNRGGLR
jgi:hypothetical protein